MKEEGRKLWTDRTNDYRSSGVVLEHVRNIYACRNCKKENITTPVITAKMPNPVLPSGIGSPSLMA